MTIVRIALSIFLGWLAFRHAAMWGRMFMNLFGMKSPSEVSRAYLNPVSRLVLFYGVQLLLLIAIWLVFPFGHWGLLVIFISNYAHKSGMRCALLRAFLQQLLRRLEEGTPYEIAWDETVQMIEAMTGVQNINVAQHRSNPTGLFLYVARTPSYREEGRDMCVRWGAYVQARGN